MLGVQIRSRIQIRRNLMFLGHPDPDPFLFSSHKGVERTEILLAKYNFNTKILAKNYIFKTEDNVPGGKL